MTMTPYATPTDYTEWAGLPVPQGIERLLVRASELLDATVTASFVVDSDTGLPTDPLDAAALRDASCAQVRFWVETGEEHDIDGLAGTPIQVGGVGGVSTVRSPVLAPQARRILKKAMLI